MEVDSGFRREVNQALEEEDREGRPWLLLSCRSVVVAAAVDGRRAVASWIDSSGVRGLDCLPNARGKCARKPS